MQCHFHVEQYLLEMVDVACIAQHQQRLLITSSHEAVVADIHGKTLLAHAIDATTSKQIELSKNLGGDCVHCLANQLVQHGAFLEQVERMHVGFHI
jgi:hypothetical protein